MQTINLRLIGLVGGAILLVGVLLLGSQYASELTKGASAEVVEYDLLPEELTITNSDYQAAIEQLVKYEAKDDLASKNQIIGELHQMMVNWAK